MEYSKVQLEVDFAKGEGTSHTEEINHLYQCILVHTLKNITMFSLHTYLHLKINTSLATHAGCDAGG